MIASACASFRCNRAFSRSRRFTSAAVGLARGPRANPNAAEVKRLERENARLQRKLEQAEAIIDAQKKLARLLESQQEDKTP